MVTRAWQEAPGTPTSEVFQEGALASDRQKGISVVCAVREDGFNVRNSTLNVMDSCSTSSQHPAHLLSQGELA